MSESCGEAVAPSNLRGRKFAPQKSSGRERRKISFRDLAKLAEPRKTTQFLMERTGCDESTAKRWLSGKSRAPCQAVYVVCATIFTSIE